MSLTLLPPALPCSSDISGDEGELLDDDPPVPAVISQPGAPNTSPTLVPHVVLAAVPSLINMEISECVKRDCSSSSIGKGIVTKDIHEFDDILIQAEGLHQQIIVICNVVFMAKILNDTFILLVLKEVQGEWRFSTIGVCATRAFDPGGYASQRFDGNSEHVGDGQAFTIKKPNSPKPDGHILITLPLRRGIEDQVEIMNEGVPTTLGGRRSVLVTISDFSIASSFGWTNENEVPSTWDPGPLVDSSCSLPVVENNLDGEVAHKSFVTSIADCYPAVRNPISREHYENLEHLDGRDGLKWLQLGIAPHEFLITIDGSSVTSFPTYVATLGVVKGLMSCLSEKLEHTKYRFREIILFGRLQRMKIDEHKEFYYVFIDSRISEPGCLIALWFPP